MSKLSSKQADEAKSLPMMNLGVELPAFDKTQYPHGGYGKMKDYGWMVIPDKNYHLPSNDDLIVRFEDLPRLDTEHYYIGAEQFSRPKPDEGHIIQSDTCECFIVGFQDGEYRFGIIAEEYCGGEYYLADNLFAIWYPFREYERYIEDESFLEEYKKEYVRRQVSSITSDGFLRGKDFLDVAIFNGDVVRPVAETALDRLGVGNYIPRNCKVGGNWNKGGASLDLLTRNFEIVWDFAEMSHRKRSDKEKDIFETFTHEIVSELGLKILDKHIFYVASIFAEEIAEVDYALNIAPSELTELCASLLAPIDNAIVYNPFARMGDMALSIPKAQVKCFENNFLLCCASRYRIAKAQQIREKSVPSPNRMDETDVHYDYITYISPVGETPGNTSAFLSTAMDKLNENGTLVCALPSKFTYGKEYASVRKKVLAECHNIEVVALPALYSPHSSVELCLLHVTKGHSEHDLIHLMDGSSFFHSNDYSSRKVLKVSSLLESRKLGTNDVVAISREYLVTNELTPSRHLIRLPELVKGFTYQPLKDLVTIIQSERASDLVLTYVSMAELTDSIVSPVIPTAKKKSGSVRKITEQSILISTNECLKFGKLQDVPTHISNSIIAVKANDSLVLEDYLLVELRSDYVQQQFRALSSGTTIKRISHNDLLNIQIAVPSKEKQQAIVAETLRGNLVESEAKLRQQFERYRKEIRVRKHAIVQNLSALDSQWKTLNSFRLRNEGNLHANDMIGRINPRPAAMFFDSIDTYLDTLKNQTHHLAEVEYDWGEPTMIEPLVFLRKYIDTHSNDRYTCELKGDDCQKMRILMPSRALHQVLDNIVTNALSHGFTNPDFKGYRIHFNAFAEEDKVIILVANNGAALSLQPDRVFIYGASSALNQKYASTDGSKSVHSGIGGHDMKEILQSYGASVSIKSINPDDNDGYTVVYRIEFNNNIL